jgi:hypothetical protein
VEELEARRLLSVSVLPQHINLNTVNHGHSVLTIRVSSDASSTTNSLVNAPQSSLAVDVLDASGHDTSLGTPLSVHPVGGDLLLKFSRSVLHGLSAGTYQLQVSDGNTADAQTGTLILFGTGKGHTPHGQGEGHHHHHSHGKHGHGSHGPSIPGDGSTTPTTTTLPPENGHGPTTAPGHNRSW